MHYPDHWGVLTTAISVLNSYCMGSLTKCGRQPIHRTMPNKVKKASFEGILNWYGDDPYCWGEHISVSRDGSEKESMALIKWLDQLVKEYRGHLIKLDIKAVILKGGDDSA